MASQALQFVNDIDTDADVPTVSGALTVTFTPPVGSGAPGWAFSSNSPVSVPARTQLLLTITLVTDGSPTATYVPLPSDPSDQAPVSWQDPAPPAWAWGMELNDSLTVLTLGITNWGPDTKGTFAFSVNVVYDGQPPFTSPDPTIINVEPT